MHLHTIDTITNGHTRIAETWISPSAVAPLTCGDNLGLWLRYHGATHGFAHDESPYALSTFLGEKGRQFEQAWIEHRAPEAIRVCGEGYESGNPARVRQTLDLMAAGVPVITQPALWWASEGLYGAPDLIARTDWISAAFPGLLEADELALPAHYVPLDLKFSNGVKEQGIEREAYGVQVRLYAYMLGHMQGLMPRRAFLITRDQAKQPIPVMVTSILDAPLDRDLAELRGLYLDIKLNGGGYLPWQDEIVAVSLGDDDQWGRVRHHIAEARVPGRDLTLLRHVSGKVRETIKATLGISSIDGLLAEDPDALRLEACKGLGGAKAREIRAILRAARAGRPTLPSASSLPPQRRHEFYLDLEFFSNVNVDFTREWPHLLGSPMIFMIGVGWAEGGEWCYESFIASAERLDAERAILDDFLAFLVERTGGAIVERPQDVALYHWASAEQTQARQAADRHGLPNDHLLRRLPLVDLQRVYLSAGCAIPNVWSAGLKAVAHGLGVVEPCRTTEWPVEMTQGASPMVLGWQAYAADDPHSSEQMRYLKTYLEMDCKALWRVLVWMRQCALNMKASSQLSPRALGCSASDR